MSSFACFYHATWLIMDALITHTDVNIPLTQWCRILDMSKVMTMVFNVTHGAHNYIVQDKQTNKQTNNWVTEIFCIATSIFNMYFLKESFFTLPYP